MLALLFLLHCENGDFSILMKDIVPKAVFLFCLTPYSKTMQSRVFTLWLVREVLIVLFCLLFCVQQQRVAIPHASWHGPPGTASGTIVKKTQRIEVPVDKYPNVCSSSSTCHCFW